ncbi:class I SAM-dependent methyltransferase [Chloroflexota bacterium]
MEKENPHDQKYADNEFYWGIEPSAICDRVIELIKPSADFRPKLIDLGSGEGRNAIYFAKSGFDVTGLDTSSIGLQKMERWAKEVGVQINAIQASIADYEIKGTCDVVFSTGTLQYLPPEIRNRHFQNYKDCTSPNGINTFSVFVKNHLLHKLQMLKILLTNTGQVN